MASDPALLTLLVGLGITDFSMTPGAIPVAKQILRHKQSNITMEIYSLPGRHARRPQERRGGASLMRCGAAVRGSQMP